MAVLSGIFKLRWLKIPKHVDDSPFGPSLQVGSGAESEGLLGGSESEEASENELHRKDSVSHVFANLTRSFLKVNSVPNLSVCGSEI